MRGLSFSNTGEARLQELLRRRLNEPEAVNWTQTLNTSHQFFAPLAMEQQANKELQNAQQSDAQKRHNIEEEWTLLGTIDVRDMPKLCSGEQGVHFTLRLNNTTEQAYYRICFMGVLGTLDSLGNFCKLMAPVEPVQAVLNNMTKLRVGGGFEHLISNTSNRANRFFLLSGSLRPWSGDPEMLPIAQNTYRRPSQRKTTRKPPSFGGLANRQQFREESLSQDSSFDERVEEAPKLHADDKVQANSKASFPKMRTSRKQRQNGPRGLPVQPESSQKEFAPSPFPSKERGASHSESNRPSKSQVAVQQASTMEFSKDERIVIDRWLALMGLNEYGEPLSTQYANKFNSPLVDDKTGERLISRYQYVASCHKTRPWMQLAKKQNWLPSPEEQRKIRKWERKHSVGKPSRFSPQQTLYEALVQLHPSLPWLTKANKVSSSDSTPTPKVTPQPPSRRYSTPARSPKVHVSKVPVSPAESSRKRPKSEATLRKEIEQSRNVLAANLKGLDRDYEQVARAQIEAQLGYPISQNDRASQSEARRLAKEATARANEEAQIAWEREEKLRQLRTLEAQRASLDKREKDLSKLEQDLLLKAKEAEWADRVTETFEQKHSDQWQRGLSKVRPPNCPI
mmetsp:Transcript_16976/g.31240  ORF Transcript_16976/g.31240 Transcript_16976/m.31240 type:complete len:625 (-) Transcript_16976:117-1991(-)